MVIVYVIGWKKRKQQIRCWYYVEDRDWTEVVEQRRGRENGMQGQEQMVVEEGERERGRGGVRERQRC